MVNMNVNQEDAFLQMNILDDKFDNKRATIKICDYLCLSEGIYMNDILMEFYMNYVYSTLSDNDKDRAHVFSTYFYTRLTKPTINPANSSLSKSKMRHNNVAKWTKNIDVFKKDFLFIPINKDKHWCLAVICFPYLSGKVDMKDKTPVNEPDDDTGRYELAPVDVEKNLDHNEADPNVEDLWLFDLCLTKNNQYKHEENYDTCVAKLRKEKHTLVKRPCILIFDSYSGGVFRASISATLRDWLHEEYCSKHNGEQKDFSCMKASLVKVPQQPNYTDCGLFVMHYFKMFYSRPIIDYTFPINHLENWFHIDDVVKNERKRREIHKIIMERIKVRGSILPAGIELPRLSFDGFNEQLDEENMDTDFEEEDEEDFITDSEEDDMGIDYEDDMGTDVEEEDMGIDYEENMDTDFEEEDEEDFITDSEEDDMGIDYEDDMGTDVEEEDMGIDYEENMDTDFEEEDEEDFITDFEEDDMGIDYEDDMGTDVEEEDMGIDYEEDMSTDVEEENFEVEEHEEKVEDEKNNEKR